MAKPPVGDVVKMQIPGSPVSEIVSLDLSVILMRPVDPTVTVTASETLRRARVQLRHNPVPL